VVVVDEVMDILLQPFCENFIDCFGGALLERNCSERFGETGVL
jgi:hypothetical protein